MKDKVVIGKKITRKDILVSCLLIVFWCCLIASVCFTGVFSYLHLSFGICVIIVVFLCIMLLLLLIPFVGSDISIEFSENQVSYFHAKGYREKMNVILRVLKGHKEIPTMTLDTNDIAQLYITYTSIVMMYAQKGYQLQMVFLMKDESSFSIVPISYGQFESGDYERALDLLERVGVNVVDRYGLRQVLNTSHEEFNKYVDAIEKRCRQ